MKAGFKLLGTLALLSSTLQAEKASCFLDQLPSWSTEVAFSSNFVNQDKPLWNLSWFHGFKDEASDDNLACQVELSQSSSEKNLSFGLGYRHFIPENHCFVGVNGFWDHSMNPENDRTGLGTELIGRYFSLGANFFTMIHSNYNEYHVNNGEQWVDGEVWAKGGCELLASMPVPFVSWMRICGKRAVYYSASGETVNQRTSSYSTQMRLTPCLQVEIGRVTDNRFDRGNFIHATFNLCGKLYEIQSNLLEGTLFSKDAFFLRDVKKLMHNKRIERNHRIIHAYDQW